jgi:hypothetical protein
MRKQLRGGHQCFIDHMFLTDILCITMCIYIYTY